MGEQVIHRAPQSNIITPSVVVPLAAVNDSCKHATPGPSLCWSSSKNICDHLAFRMKEGRGSNCSQELIIKGISSTTELAIKNIQRDTLECRGNNGFNDTCSCTYLVQSLRTEWMQPRSGTCIGPEDGIYSAWMTPAHFARGRGMKWTRKGMPPILDNGISLSPFLNLGQGPSNMSKSPLPQMGRQVPWHWTSSASSKTYT